MESPQVRTVSIHQPNYIPWLGYFYKIYKADVFVFHDDVQFSKRGMHNYHYIKTAEGSLKLKIPVEEKFGYKINEVRTRDELGWKTTHLRLVEVNYRKAKYFDEIFSDLSFLINNDYPNLAVLNTTIIKYICSKFNIITSFINASELRLTSKREEKVIDIVKELHGNIYYSGIGAMAYQNEENFNIKGIQLLYSNYQPFEYQQLYDEFISNVSIIDFLMNCGYNWDLVCRQQESS